MTARTCSEAVSASKPGCPPHREACCVGSATAGLGSAYSVFLLGVVAELPEKPCSACLKAERVTHGFRIPSPRGLSHWALGSPLSVGLGESVLPCPAGESAHCTPRGVAEAASHSVDHGLAQPGVQSSLRSAALFLSGQVPPPAQEGSAPSPVAAFSPGSHDEAFLLEAPEGALQARPAPGGLPFLRL